jgi:Putative peptidoglycan binding domain
MISFLPSWLREIPVNKTGGRSMIGHHGTIIVVAASLFQLVGIAHLHAAEGAAAFDCSKDRTPLGVTVCGDEATIAAERRTTASYLAAYYGLPESRRPGFRNEHVQWLNGLNNRCSRPTNLRQADQSPLSVECVRRSYTQRGDVYRQKLTGVALEESDLSLALLKKIQRRLVELKFLSGDADGVFGANTRVAIRNYQASIDHGQSNFLSAEERNMLLDAPSIQASALESRQTPAREPVSAAEDAKPPEPQTFLQNLDNRPLQPDTTERTTEQTPKQTASDAIRPPDNTDVVVTVDRNSMLKTRYFIEGGAIAVVILILTIDSVLVRRRRRVKSVSKGVDIGDDLAGISLKTDTLRIKASMQGRQFRVFSSVKAPGSNLDNAGNSAPVVPRDARRA